jgi:hypothetical protein
MTRGFAGESEEAITAYIVSENIRRRHLIPGLRVNLSKSEAECHQPL